MVRIKQPIGYITDPMELVTQRLLQKVEAARREYQVLCVGVHSDELFEQIYHRKPIKPFEERVRLANALKGVDSVFKLTTENLAFEEKIEVPGFTTENSEKKYKVAFVPGTYDLFHEGHLQHLLEARSQCEILVAGVNSDDLVYSNKKKQTRMRQDERMAILKSFKIVDYVYLVESNNKQIANDWVKNKLGRPIDAIFLGSDLVGQDPKDNPENIPLVFTERDPIVMEKRSSTYYRTILEQQDISK